MIEEDRQWEMVFRVLDVHESGKHTRLCSIARSMKVVRPAQYESFSPVFNHHDKPRCPYLLNGAETLSFPVPILYMDL